MIATDIQKAAQEAAAKATYGACQTALEGAAGELRQIAGLMTGAQAHGNARVARQAAMRLITVRARIGQVIQALDASQENKSCEPSASPSP